MKKRLTYFSPCSGTIPYAAMNTLMGSTFSTGKTQVQDSDDSPTGDPQ